MAFALHPFTPMLPHPGVPLTVQVAASGHNVVANEPRARAAKIAAEPPSATWVHCYG
jgi:hypothetical protein